MAFIFTEYIHLSLKLLRTVGFPFTSESMRATRPPKNADLNVVLGRLQAAYNVQWKRGAMQMETNTVCSVWSYVLS